MPFSGLKSCAASVSSGAQNSSCRATSRTLTWSWSRRLCSHRLQRGSSKPRCALFYCRLLYGMRCVDILTTCTQLPQAGLATRKNMSGSASRMLVPPEDARSQADAERSSGAGYQQFAAMFGGKEYDKMVSLNEVEDCMDTE